VTKLSGKSEEEKKTRQKEQTRVWLEKHPGYFKQYYAANREKHREGCKQARQKNPEKYREHSRTYRERQGADHNTERNLRHRFDITLDEKKQMLLKQNGVCVICLEPLEFKDAFTDHDHALDGWVPKRETVRGLLCRQCNFLAWHMEVTPADRIARAKRYVDNHGCV
jgi:hypothetical protein